MPNMMEEIKQVTIRKWIRSYEIIVKNIFNKLPVLLFKVQMAKLEDGVFTASSMSDLEVKFDMTEHYPFIDPRDDSVILDEMFLAFPRHFQIQIILYSQFKHVMK